MANNSALLAGIFQNVAKTLANNQQALNQADDLNHDHGTNMVNTFQSIANSLESKKESSGSAALSYAAKQLSKEATSGSGKQYAQNLAAAATQMKGQSVNPTAAIQVLQTLLGGSQTGSATGQPAGNDILGSLLGGLAGSGQSNQSQAQTQSSGGDLLGSILGELAGGSQAQPAQQPAQQQGGGLLGGLLGDLTGTGNTQAGTSNAPAANNGLDMGDLLNAGMTYMQAKQAGGSNASALIQAVIAGSGMGNSNHRAQSTQLVANSFLQALGTLASK